MSDLVGQSTETLNRQNMREIDHQGDERERDWLCALDSTGSGKGKVAGYCKYGN